LIAEDNVVEYATFVVFLLAALVAVKLVIELRQQHETVLFL
jgi:hypothetical protein